MQPLLVATRNANKTREFRALLGKDFDVHDLSSFDQIAIPKESGHTFEENAIAKAMAVAQDRHLLVFGEDSGLEVDALDGAPGISSARYAGEDASDKENIDKLLGDQPAFVAASRSCVKANYSARSKELSKDRLPITRAVRSVLDTIRSSFLTGSIKRLVNCRPTQKTRSVIGRKRLLPCVRH
jgi:non-canonical purine NTP pyrophosphatase (RdgB/HAM1 family)